MTASVRVRDWSRRRPAVPAVSNVRFVLDPGAEVHGIVRNSAHRTLSATSSVYAVLFDASGNVVGGGSALLERRVRPGGRAAFRVVRGVDATPVERVASVRASVEADYS